MELQPQYRFDNFVVGAANRLAAAAARAVAEAPGAVYNPLFIYSQSGLGKTHLLEAIGHRARQLQPDITVEYVALEEFMEQLHVAVSTGQAEAFKRRYQTVDLLLLDDVQFLAGRRETQAELLRFLNSLQGSGRQVVLTSDRPPSEIADLDERLISRLSGGLVVDIDVPDYETRVAILRQKCSEREVHFRAGVIEELARIQFASVRELQGALNRLVAFQGLGVGEVAPLDVRSLVGDRPTTPAPARPSSGPSARTSGPTVRTSGPRVSQKGEFQSFLTDVAHAVAQHVEPWRIKLGEAIAYWGGEGYRTGVLERALRQTRPPDVDGLLAHYAAAIEHLRKLEREVGEIDPALGGADLFRDPERVGEAEALVQKAQGGQMPPPGPSPAFARESYEVGVSNQLAVRAADAVVQEPGKRYNPLFVYGPSGVGKTHLINAVGNGLIEASGGALTVACASAQTFMDELIGALQAGTVERWRARYRRAHALVLDDVHFVAGKERTQDELFHVFNALYAAGRQIVLASDRPPKELQGLEERLRSRFEGGLVIGIQHPDRQLRKRLSARFLSQLGGAPDEALLDYLADRPATSVREIAGTINRLAAAADLAGVALTSEFAAAEIEGSGAAPPPAPSTMRTADAFFLDSEKVVWDWPDLGGRIVEELR